MKCPNCGSTAQVRQLTEHLFICGCGYVFEEAKESEEECTEKPSI